MNNNNIDDDDDDSNNSNNQASIVSIEQITWPRDFPDIDNLKNRSYTRLIRRVEETFGYHTTRSIETFLDRHSIYRQFSCDSFQEAFSKVERYLERSK